MEDLFLQACDSVSLDQASTTRAWNLWERARRCFCPEVNTCSRSRLEPQDIMHPLPWYACAIYIATNPALQEDSGASVVPWISVDGLARSIPLSSVYTLSLPLSQNAVPYSSLSVLRLFLSLL